MVRNILIVDDDDEDRELLFLAINGLDPTIECVEAEGGDKAFSYLSSCKQLPDYIFLDLNMPKINGLQTLEMIKNHPRFKNIPVIIYTTSKSKSDHQKARQLGAILFITKPDKLSELVKALKFVFERNWEEPVVRPSEIS
jgi:CheY-like chemotaxis protein